MVRAPFYALALLPAIALGAATLQAQRVADPGRSADAAFVAKASDATAVGVELATLAVARTCDRSEGAREAGARLAHRARA